MEQQSLAWLIIGQIFTLAALVFNAYWAERKDK